MIVIKKTEHITLLKRLIREHFDTLVMSWQDDEAQQCVELAKEIDPEWSQELENDL